MDKAMHRGWVLVGEVAVEVVGAAVEACASIEKGGEVADSG